MIILLVRIARFGRTFGLRLGCTVMIEDKQDRFEDEIEDDGSDLVASPYLMRPLRTLPTAQKMRDTRARIVAGQDRRVAEREPTEKPASATVANRTEPVACIVRDISQTGARIELADDTTFLPKNMKIYIMDMKLVVECQQRWRRGNEIGLAFVFGSDD
jgi:hypothetical protein